MLKVCQGCHICSLCVVIDVKLPGDAVTSTHPGTYQAAVGTPRTGLDICDISNMGKSWYLA